jgi:hypothetical protein
MTDDVVPLDQQLEFVLKRYGSIQNYKEHFCKLGERDRQAELYIFNKAFDEQPAKPTRDYAAHVQLRRELNGLDSLLRNSGR